MTLYEILGNETLKNKHVLKMLLMHHLGYSKEDLVLRMDESIEKAMYDIVLRDYWRYVNDKEPLEYIMGYVSFGNDLIGGQRKFFVDRNTMIPRPETEYMIQAIVEELEERKKNTIGDGNHILIDVGTGCGVLGLSAFLSSANWANHVYLLDYYPECLLTASKNMQNLLSQDQQKKVELAESNLLAHIFDNKKISSNDEVVVTANLPYIPTETFDEQAEENVHLREPRYAFVSGDDGLDLYREMFGQILFYRGDLSLREGFTTLGDQEIYSQIGQLSFTPQYFVMYLEMMTWQVDVLRKEFPWLEFEEVKTFHFQIRIVRASLRK